MSCLLGSCPLTGGAFCWFGMGAGILWWVAASSLVYFSWNKVVASLVTVKQAKFWHALLIVATLAIFCAPRYLKKRGYKGKHGSYSCHHSKGYDHKGYHSTEGQDKADSQEEPHKH